MNFFTGVHGAYYGIHVGDLATVPAGGTAQATGKVYVASETTFIVTEFDHANVKTPATFVVFKTQDTAPDVNAGEDTVFDGNYQ